jgi:hypothetical protein
MPTAFCFALSGVERDEQQRRQTAAAAADRECASFLLSRLWIDDGVVS